MISTARERQVLRAILKSVDDRGYPPSVMELTRELKIASTNGTIQHLVVLKNKGLLEREKGVARALRLTKLALEELEATKGVAAIDDVLAASGLIK